MQCPEWVSGAWSGWGMGMHWLWAMPLIFVVAGVICLLFLLSRVPRHMQPWFGWHMPHMPHMPSMPWAHETAQQILDRRFVSGDINKEQYEDVKRSLLQWEGKSG